MEPSELRAHAWEIVKKLLPFLAVCGLWFGYWFGTLVLAPIPRTSPYWLYSRVGMIAAAPFLAYLSAKLFNIALE